MSVLLVALTAFLPKNSQVMRNSVLVPHVSTISEVFAAVVPMEMKKRNWGDPEGKTPLQLYDLETDIHEDRNVAHKHPAIVRQLRALAEKMKEDIGDAGVKGRNQRPAGWVKEPRPQILKNK